MSVLIQSFVLCEKISHITGGIADLHKSSIYELFPQDGKFPFTFALSFYLLVHKTIADDEEELNIEMAVYDQEGKTTKAPGINTIKGDFPRGSYFRGITGTIQFLIERPGLHTISITQLPSALNTYYYTFEVRRTPR